MEKNRILKFLPRPQKTEEQRESERSCPERYAKTVAMYEGIPAGPKHEFMWWYLSANLDEPHPLLVDVDGLVLARMADEEVWVFGHENDLPIPSAKKHFERLRAMPPGLYMMGIKFDFDPAMIHHEYPAWRDVTINCLTAGPLRVAYPGRPGTDGSA